MRQRPRPHAARLAVFASLASYAVIAALALPLVACGGGAPRPAESAPATAALVEPAEMQISIGGEALKMHADGTVDGPKGERVGTLGRDGRLLAKSGKAAVTLHEDGRVEVPDQGDVVLTLGADGALTLTAKSETVTYRIGDDGVLTDGTEPMPIKVTGADTVGKRRAAMLMIAPFTFARPKKD